MLYLFFLRCKFISSKIGGSLICLSLKVMEDDREVGAYMFRRTVPSMRLTAEDVPWMVCLHFMRVHFELHDSFPYNLREYFNS